MAKIFHTTEVPIDESRLYMLRVYGKVRQVIKTTHNEVTQLVHRLSKPLCLCLKDEFLYMAALKDIVQPKKRGV